MSSFLSQELHVRLPTKLIKRIDKAVRRYPELHMDRSDFIRGSCVRRLKEIGMWGEGK